MSEHSPVPFAAHVALLRTFIAQRAPIVERIQGVLNAQDRPASFLQDRMHLSRLLEDCFFLLPGLAREHTALRGQLQRAHWEDGFQPRDMPGIPNEMFDPADMTARAFNVWRHTRWPGRNARVRYAHTLFNLQLVRCLTLLDMRVCDDGAGASARLAQLQTVLDALWASSPADQPVLVRDVRWLVPVAQSPTTDDLGRYFEAARRFEVGLDEADRLEIHRASVLMAGGHLRSQLRHFTMQGRALDEPRLVLSTRGSNALDCAMTIQHLVPLLEAYEQAIGDGDADRRRQLAGVICQGISPDPELFVLRLDLLGAYSMIEHLFASAPPGGAVTLTPMGQRHVALLHRYVALVPRLAAALAEDCVRFRPLPGHYSPYGVMYGFSSNILEHMTLKALQPDAPTRFSLEDVFADEGDAAQRLAWVGGWRRLAHVPPEVQKLYEYPQAFAEQIFQRIEAALHARVHGDLGSIPRTGRLLVNGAGAAQGAAGMAGITPLSADHVLASDPQIVALGRARAAETERLLGDRREGMHLVSYPTPGGWVAVSKDVLTEVLGAGRDARLDDLPDAAARVLKLLYPGLVEAGAPG